MNQNDEPKLILQNRNRNFKKQKSISQSNYYFLSMVANRKFSPDFDFNVIRYSPHDL